MLVPIKIFPSCSNEGEKAIDQGVPPKGPKDFHPAAPKSAKLKNINPKENITNKEILDFLIDRKEKNIKQSHISYINFII